MNLRVAIRGDLERFAAAEAKAGAGAVTTAIRRRTTQLKNAIRRQIASVGLGERLGKTIRDDVYPRRGASLSAKGVVRSSAIYKRPGGLVDLITVFEEGATINARGGRFLAIPLGAGKKESLSKFTSRDLVFLPIRNGRAAGGYLVLLRGSNAERATYGLSDYGKPLFILVPQVSIRKRLSLDPLIERATAGIEDLIVREWERRASRAGIA